MDRGITIRFSDCETSEDIIYDLMEIEKDVYPEGMRGEYDSICSRFSKNKNMFILACDNDKIVGYLCFFPISKRLHDEILNERVFRDDDISADDVVEFSQRNYIYLISIALYKAYQGQGIGKLMMDAFIDTLVTMKTRQKDVVDILASVVTYQGKYMVEKYGFTLVREPIKNEHFLLYKLDGSDL